MSFDEEEVDQLWQAATKLPEEYNSLLQQAKYHCDLADYSEAQDHLDCIRKHLGEYPNFDRNPLIHKWMRYEMASHLLPLSHPMKPILDEIFSFSRVTKNLDTLQQAGFKILRLQASSFIVIAEHPRVKGYLFKIYPDSERRTRYDKPSWRWLLDRCIGAKRIRKIIAKNKIKHFTVPDKWIYPLPPFPTQGVQHVVVLIAKKMHLVSGQETREAWMTQVTTQHLDELYTILKHGCGSNYLSGNIPYTKEGKFTFIDTEYPKRSITLSKIKPYIAPELHPYWDHLIGKEKE